MIDHLMRVIFVKDYPGCGSRLFSKAVMGENKETRSRAAQGKLKQKSRNKKEKMNLRNVVGKKILKFIFNDCLLT